VRDYSEIFEVSPDQAQFGIVRGYKAVCFVYSYKDVLREEGFATRVQSSRNLCLHFPDMLVSVVFRGDARIPFEIPAKKERITVPDLLSDLLDGIAALQQTSARVVDSLTPQPVDWG
jgi:hypothetical protein